MATLHPGCAPITMLVRSCSQLLTIADRLLFPPSCYHCQRLLAAEEQFLCHDCQQRCLQQPHYCCPRCDHPLPATSTSDHLCHSCLSDPPPFLWLKTAGIYTDLLSELLQQVKFHGRPGLAAPLGELILEQHLGTLQQFSPHLIIPVPLHRQRLRERGYNQAQLISAHIAKALHIPLATNMLTRHRATQPQPTLTFAQRHTNLHGAFTAVRHPAQRILLVDDIVTTTATARACSRLLTRHGHQVGVVAVARARLDRSL